MDTDAEYQESTSITFEWTLNGIKSLFESTKGESKSKASRSVKFGGDRWQLIFYPNSGTEGGFSSLYISCEPTTEEKESTQDGKWAREGVYKFSFELRSIGKAILFHQKEAHNHTFTHKTANWGWAQFVRRENITQNSFVKQQNAFVIICTIDSSAAAPPPSPSEPQRSVPISLLSTVGSLLDNPLYSDVCFVLPRPGQPMKNARKIFATRALLERASYFADMFGSGFAEEAPDRLTFSIGGHVPADAESSNSASTYVTRYFEDSDDEDDEFDWDEVHTVDDDVLPTGPETLLNSSSNTLAEDMDGTDQVSNADEDGQSRNIKAKLSHPSSPHESSDVLENHRSSWPRSPKLTVSGPLKRTVIVKDVAYSTYRAVLYYIYTNSIVFAPLSSCFQSSSSHKPSRSTPVTASASTPTESQANTGSNVKPSTDAGPSSRRAWITDWLKDNNDQGRPCSAKAAYRLADKLGLVELKSRAAEHIIKSLTVDNISYEVFSPFSAAFEDIRKVQVRFFLEHWTDIRKSDAMRNVWLQIRNGRHPGFEEVWPVIAQSLEFTPRTGNSLSGHTSPVEK